MKFPVGISSLEAWGRTVLEVGKYAHSKFSYVELASSQKQDHQSHCSWLIPQQHRVDLTPPMKDLVHYL